jgi:hypothetical protein
VNLCCSDRVDDQPKLPVSLHSIVSPVILISRRAGTAWGLFCFAFRKTSYTALSANPTKNLANL